MKPRDYLSDFFGDRVWMKWMSNEILHNLFT